MAPWIAMALCLVEGSWVFHGHSGLNCLWLWFVGDGILNPAGRFEASSTSHGIATLHPGSINRKTLHFTSPHRLKDRSAGSQALTAPSLRAMLCGIRPLQAGLGAVKVYGLSLRSWIFVSWPERLCRCYSDVDLVPVAANALAPIPSGSVFGRRLCGRWQRDVQHHQPLGWASDQACEAEKARSS